MEKFDLVKLVTPKFKAYDKVILIADKAKYKNVGVKKGDLGIVLEEQAVKDFVLVDFSSNADGEDFFEKCIAVKFQDLVFFHDK